VREVRRFIYGSWGCLILRKYMVRLSLRCCSRVKSLLSRHFRLWRVQLRLVTFLLLCPANTSLIFLVYIVSNVLEKVGRWHHGNVSILLLVIWLMALFESVRFAQIGLVGVLVSWRPNLSVLKEGGISCSPTWTSKILLEEILYVLWVLRHSRALLNDLAVIHVISSCIIDFLASSLSLVNYKP
jgi:hypothetical protein